MSNFSIQTTSKIYNLNYNFDAKWQPEYVLGSKSPIQVQLNQISETLDLTTDTFKKVNFSGELFESYFTRLIDSVLIYPITGSTTLEIPLTGFTLKTEESQMQMDNIVYQKLSFFK